MVYVQGLAVELRPYQRQSLQFMLDAEQTEGDFRHHLFYSVTNSKGQHYWYSPLLGRLCLHVPPMPHGGFLGEFQHQHCCYFVASCMPQVRTR